MDLYLKMPDLATTGSDVRLIRWLAQPGQAIQRGQPLFEVETDKSVSQVESVVTGVIKELRMQPDSPVSAGQVIAVVEVGVSSPARDHEVQETLIASPAVSAKAADDAGPRGTAAPAQPKERISASPPLAASDSAVRTPALAQTVYKRPFLLALYERMVLIREFEDLVKALFLEGTMAGTIHQCQGQEATAVGVCSALGAEDWITSTFRGHGHALAKGLTPQELLDELFGASTGCCKGKGGSMHVGNMGKGMVPGIAIVAGGIPLAAGMALAFKMEKGSRVVACFFGDGAVAEGAFHEGINMAALWKLPVIFVCENNLYGASTHISKVMKNTRISDRAAAYGFRGQTVDGNDVLAVYGATRQAAAECRAGQGPVLLELLTYRRTGHSRRDPCQYQPMAERDTWFKSDPLDRFAAWLRENVSITSTDLAEIKARVVSQLDEAVQKAKQAPPPTVNDLCTDVFA